MNIEENIARSSELRGQSHKVGVAFLKTELDTALTFVQSALQAGDDRNRRARNLANARKGYDTFLYLRGRWWSDIDLSEREEMEIKLKSVQSALMELGEKL